MNLELKAQPRAEKGNKNKSLRAGGSIPAVLYGYEVLSLPISVDKKEFLKVYKEAGETSIVNVLLEQDGKTQRHPVLIHDVDRDPVKNDILHVDFYRVNLKESITAHVPLVFVGESLAVKNLKGVLVKNIYELEVEAMPDKLPKEIVVDISSLATFDDVIAVKNLSAGDAVTILANPEDIAALVTEPRSEQEMASLKEEVASDVSAIKTESEEKRAEKEKAKEAGE